MFVHTLFYKMLFKLFLIWFPTAHFSTHLNLNTANKISHASKKLFEGKTGIDLTGNDRAHRRLRTAVEKAKRILSSAH